MAGTSPAMTWVESGCCLAQDHDLGAEPDAVVEVDHVLVRHADAARGDRLADGLGLVRAMDAVERAAEIHGAGAERVLGAARHVARQVGPAADHLGRRAPVRPLALQADRLRAGPLEARAPDADRVLDRLAAARHVIEPALLGRDHDGAGRVAGVEADELARDRRRLRPVLLVEGGVLLTVIAVLRLRSIGAVLRARGVAGLPAIGGVLRLPRLVGIAPEQPLSGGMLREERSREEPGKGQDFAMHGSISLVTC